MRARHHAVKVDAMNNGFRVFLVILSALLALARAGTHAQADAAADAPALDDIPKVQQLLALPGGRTLVLTTEKGGLYLSDSGGGGWRKAEGVPDVFVHRVSLAPGGRVYLATSEGLYAFAKGKWQKSAEGAFSGIFFNGDGSAAMLRHWGRGLSFLDARGMTAESLQAMQDAAARQAAMASEEEELKRQMARLPRGDNATLEEKRAVMRVYTQWQDLEKRKEQAASQAEAGMPVRVMDGLPEGASVVGAIPWEGGWLAGVFGHGAFSLIDGSRQWSPRQDGLPGPWILTLEASPWGQAFAGFFGAGLLSLDPGSTAWKRVDGVPADCSVQAVSFGPGGQVLVATRERGVLFSPDRGQTWKPGPGGNVQGVAVGSDGSLWAGLWEGGLRVSSDSGASWKPRPFAYVGPVADMAFSESGRGFAVLVGLGLLVTADNGASWSQAELPVRPARDVRLALDRDGRLFAASPREGLFVSADNGATWARDKQGLPDGGVMAVAVAPGGSVLAIPGDGSGLFARGGSGEWTLVPLVGEDGWDYGVWDLAFLPGGRAMAFGPQDLILSDDGGRTWHRHRFGQAMREVAVDASGTIFTRRMMSTFALRPGAEESDEIPAIPADAYRLLRQAGGGRWLGARLDGGLDVLEERGPALAPVAGHAPGSVVTSLAAGADGALFAGLEDGMIMSTDGGRTWRRCELIDY
jgi:hypothetical protein